MLKDIIDEITEELTAAGVTGVYSAFDAKAAERKGFGFFTVVGIDSLNAFKPVYAGDVIYIPFRAEVGLDITAPEDGAADKLYSYFDREILPVICGSSGTAFRPGDITIKHDSSINRLVLKVKLTAEGAQKKWRSST
ncbi:MAG: hypothetical protein IJ874_07480 [Ruminococcus sp.]|nr:hypothetical protein [Ruminococcus sp.]